MPKRLKKFVAVTALFVAAGFAQQPRPAVFVETTTEGFDTYLVAAITQKHVPVDVVLDSTKADYIIETGPVEMSKETSAGKIARCLFAYCIGIEDKGTVSVRLMDRSSSSKVLWAYSVAKQTGAQSKQSMAEAVAKHLKRFLEDQP